MSQQLQQGSDPLNLAQIGIAADEVFRMSILIFEPAGKLLQIAATVEPKDRRVFLCQDNGTIGQECRCGFPPRACQEKQELIMRIIGPAMQLVAGSRLPFSSFDEYTAELGVEIGKPPILRHALGVEIRAPS